MMTPHPTRGAPASDEDVRPRCRTHIRGWSILRIKVTVNGTAHESEVEDRTLLVHYIRDGLGLTGTNIGCDTSSCGACTLHVDGESVKSCTMLAAQADGTSITTIEGLATNGTLHKVQKAWVEHEVPQCGYCQAGMIMAVAALLREKPKPTDADIDASITNICRCGTFQQVRDAIHAAAKA